MASGNLYRLLAVLAMMIIVASSYSRATQIQKNHLIGAALIVFYMVAIAFIVGESYTYRIGVIILLLTSTSFGIWTYSPNTSSKDLWIVVLWIIVLFSIWNTTSIRGVLEHPTVMRQLVSSEKGDDLPFSVWGVGGYGYMYSAIIMLPIGMDILFNRSHQFKPIVRLGAGYFVVTTLILSYLSQYFLSLIIAVIAVVLSLLRGRRSSVNHSSFFIVFLIIFLVALSIEPLLDFLIDVVDIKSINDKLVEMRAIMILGEDIGESEFMTRYERYTRDLKLFISNPLLGALKYTSIGKHSTILDLLAQYGVIIGSFSVSLLLRPCLTWTKQKMALAGDVLILVIIIGLFNVLTLQASAPLCIAIPAYCQMLCVES